MSINVYDMIKSALIEVGADGLCNDGCGCSIDDIAPGYCLNGFCEAAKCEPMPDDQKAYFGYKPEQDVDWFVPFIKEESNA